MLVGSTTSTSAAAAAVSASVSDQSSKVEQMETLSKTSRVIRNGDTSSSPAGPTVATAIYRENQETVDQQNEAENIQQQSTQEEEVDLLRNCDGIR